MTSEVPIFQANLDLLKRRFPFIYQMVERIESPGRFPLLATATSAATVKRRTPDGREIFVHSSKDPLSEAERVAESMRPGQGILLFLGCGLFYHILASVRSLPKTRPVVLIEKDAAMLDAALRAADLEPVLARNATEFFVDASPEDIESLLIRNYPSGSLAGLQILRHLPCVETAPEYYADVEKRARFQSGLADCLLGDPELAAYLGRNPKPKQVTLDKVLANTRRSADKIPEGRGVLLMMHALSKE